MALTLLSGCAVVGEPADQPITSLGLDAVTQVQYPVGSRFSFGLASVEPTVTGEIVDVALDVRGPGLRILGFQATAEGNPSFDVRDVYPPTAKWIRGLRPAIGATVAADAQGVRLVVGLEVTDDAHTEIRGVQVTLVDAQGVEQVLDIPVGLIQCGPTVTDKECRPL